MSEPKPPWYRRPLLPAWFPTWLAVALLIAVGFGAAFGLLLDDPNPLRVTAVATPIGFGLAIVVLSLAAAKYRGDKPNPIAPPEVIRYPVLTGIFTLWPLSWALDREVGWPGGGGLFTGELAVAFGLLGLLAIAGLLGLAVWTDRRQTGSFRSSKVLSFLVPVGALVYAVVRVAAWAGG